MDKLLLIVNPVTAKKMMTPVIIDAIDIFEQNGYDVTTHISKAKGEVTEYVEKFGSLFDVIVCAGGDGTLNETISGVLKLEKRPRIGYIPSGTTNDFAKSWGIPQKPMKAVEAIVTKEARRADVSTFCGRPYVYVSAFGAFTKASYSAPQKLKKNIGWAAYILEGIKTIPDIRPFRVKFEYDGGEIEDNFLYGMISNTTHVGGFDLKMKSEVSLDDGLMELILIKKPDTFAENPKLLNDVTKQDITSEYIKFIHTKHVKFTSEDPLVWTIDGECGGEINEGEADVIPGAIELFY